jgi:hypothetical protein
MSEPDDAKLFLTARHEGAHVTAAWAVGDTVTSARFRSKKWRARGKLGKMSHTHNPELAAFACSQIRGDGPCCCERIKTAKYIVIAIAGLIVDHAAGALHLEGSDAENILRWANELSGGGVEERNQLILDLGRIAKDILERWPSAINLIALGIVRDKVLRQKQIHGWLGEPLWPWFFTNQIAAVIKAAPTSSTH